MQAGRACDGSTSPSQLDNAVCELHRKLSAQDACILTIIVGRRLVVITRSLALFRRPQDYVRLQIAVVCHLPDPFAVGSLGMKRQISLT